MLLQKLFSPRARKQPPSNDFSRQGCNWRQLWRAVLGPKLPMGLAESCMATVSQTKFCPSPVCLLPCLSKVWSQELPNKPCALQIISETVTWGTQHKTTDLFHLVSQTKTNIIQYCLYVESKKKKKRSSWTYLQDRNRLIEEKFTGAGGEGWGERGSLGVWD